MNNKGGRVRERGAGEKKRVGEREEWGRRIGGEREEEGLVERGRERE